MFGADHTRPVLGRRFNGSIQPVCEHIRCGSNQPGVNWAGFSAAGKLNWDLRHGQCDDQF